MKSSSLLLHTEAPPRGKLAAMMPSRWSATGVSDGMMSSPCRYVVLQDQTCQAEFNSAPSCN